MFQTLRLPPQMNKDNDMDANWDPTLSEPLEEQHQQHDETMTTTTTTDLYKYGIERLARTSYMQEKKRKKAIVDKLIFYVLHCYIFSLYYHITIIYLSTTYLLLLCISIHLLFLSHDELFQFEHILHAFLHGVVRDIHAAFFFTAIAFVM